MPVPTPIVITRNLELTSSFATGQLSAPENPLYVKWYMSAQARIARWPPAEFGETVCAIAIPSMNKADPPWPSNMLKRRPMVLYESIIPTATPQRPMKDFKMVARKGRSTPAIWKKNVLDHISNFLRDENILKFALLHNR